MSIANVSGVARSARDDQRPLGTRPSLVLLNDGNQGWGPILHFAQLAARLLDLELLRPEPPAATRIGGMRRLIFPARRGTEPGVIYLAKSPGSIKSLTQLQDFARPRRFRALWIVDSFWTEWAPLPRLMRQFDLVIYMQKYEADVYEQLAPGRALFLGWGADVLDLGSSCTDRPIDLLRVGRQPEAWDNDKRSEAACRTAGLKFSGRPPFLPEDVNDLSAGHRDLCARYAGTKFVLAHSNIAAPASYTHPVKEYITARWTDALAAGAVVAGIPPFTDTSCEDLLWDGATLVFDRIDLVHNVEAVRAAAEIWNPTTAIRNRLEALKRLDWRWRLKSMADCLDIATPELDRELELLRTAISIYAEFLSTEVDTRKNPSL